MTTPLFKEYPKKFSEADIKCFHHVKNQWALHGATAAPELCKTCKYYLSYFLKQYEDLVGDKLP